MAVTVKLDRIVDAFEMQFDETSAYLDPESGEVYVISDELLRMVESSDDDEEPDCPAWQLDEWKVARRILTTDDLKGLPTKFDIHEWEIMRDFVNTIDSGPLRDRLEFAIHGSGAFRHFKNTVHEYGIAKDWYQFRTDALRKIAINWCEANAIPWEE